MEKKAVPSSLIHKENDRNLFLSNEPYVLFKWKYSLAETQDNFCSFLP